MRLSNRWWLYIVALLAFILVLLGLGRIAARAGPKISPTNTPVATPFTPPPLTETPTPLTETQAPTETLEPTSTSTATYGPTPTMTRRPWASVVPTRTPWPRFLPCSEEGRQYVTDEYNDTLVGWVEHWYGWVERYRDLGYHDIPAEIILSIIMQESRGSPRARGAAGEIGIMQVLPDTVMPGRPSVPVLKQSSKNLYHGIGILQMYTWEGAYLFIEATPEYRTLKYVEYPLAVDFLWWSSREGRSALGMYQCGPGGLRSGYCGRYGGYVYAESILECWVPWVRKIIDPEVLDYADKNVPVLFR